ncbi:transcriptional regulator [Actinomadura sp. NBRC 104425]|uniref:helix-turn-helix domain-containing protein n=1 Tax=Actinomadura sp. NBRC 104425 TaxID=3032204 RepID=UPI00249FF5B1|nr:helix-turn-helix transcriptional regulator [Actinomadura sp. NBRC 104425]GLZ12270.1 transcriptional regulator [Actinomadura sp. NBRC 104425]
MSATPRPSVRQQRLAAELRRLRAQSGFTGDEVADRLSWSTAKVSRLENARTGARLSDVEMLLELYGVNGRRRAELIALARDAAQRGWWEDYPWLDPGYAQLISLETEADAELQWENVVVPGLLQTESYARHVVGGWNYLDRRISPQEIERRIELRIRRQEVLRRPDPMRLELVLDEAVLHRRVGDAAVMAEQMEHLRRSAELPHISLRILPLDGFHAVMEPSFTLLEFSDIYDVQFPDIVYSETLTMDYLTDESVSFRARLAHQQMSEDALDPVESRIHLAAARDMWRSRV